MGVIDQISIGSTPIPLDWVEFRTTLLDVVVASPNALQAGMIDLPLAPSAQIELARRPAGEVSQKGFNAILKGQNVEIGLCCPKEALADMIAMQATDVKADAVSDGLAVLLCEHIFLQPLKALEAALETPLRLETGESSSTNSASLTLQVTADHHVWNCALHCTETVAKRLEALFPAADPKPPIPVPDDLTVPISLGSPAFTMTADEVAAMSIGDVVLLDPKWRGHEGLSLHLGTTRVASIDTHDSAGPYLVGSFANPSENEHSRSTKNMTDSSSETEETVSSPVTERAKDIPNAAGRGPNILPSGTLDNINIEIAVELEHMTMPLADLRKLTAGSVLPFSGNFDALVTVTANGVHFASGELVRIGERTGVRLTALN